MKKMLLFIIVSVFISSVGYSQYFSLSDTTITFKNREVKVLTKDEVRELMKNVFSIHQENMDGRKVVTILPPANDEVSLQQARLETFKNCLLNKAVKSFHLTDHNGKKWNSKELGDKTVVINFWFTACKPCIAEMIYLNKLVEENKDSSVIFIAPAPENEIQIKKFLKRYISTMHIENVPTHLVIDKQGIIRQVYIGYADDIRKKVQAEIDKLMN